MDLTVRSNAVEMMDTTPLSDRDMGRVLDFLSLTNRWFGGVRVITRYLDQWLAEGRIGNSISILDVGTGAGDIPMALCAWAKRRNIRASITGIELVPEIVVSAQEHCGSTDIDIEQADLFELAETGRRFDVVTASLFLHHMVGDDAPRALSAFDRLATRGVIVSDLLRSHWSYWNVAAASWIFGNHVVRHDGPLSVARSFRVEELEAMAVSQGLSYLSARHEPWCRLSLAGVK